MMLTIVLGLCFVSCHPSTESDVSEGSNRYDPARPPLVRNQFPYVQSAYCSAVGHSSGNVVIWVFDSTGAPLPQFTVKALKPPYRILANTAFFSTDQNGFAKIPYKGCDSLELANLSYLLKRPCRISTANMPDTIVINLTLSQEKFIQSGM